MMQCEMRTRTRTCNISGASIYDFSSLTITAVMPNVRTETRPQEKGRNVAVCDSHTWLTCIAVAAYDAVGECPHRAKERENTFYRQRSLPVPCIVLYVIALSLGDSASSPILALLWVRITVSHCDSRIKLQ